jgi:cyclin B
MANQNPLLELGHQSMLRIIRSARSRLSREHSADDDKAARRAFSKEHVERPAKRSSTARASAFAVSGRTRLMRSRSSVDCSQSFINSENAAPEKPQNPPAALGGGVLGDVTHVTNIPPPPYAPATCEIVEKSMLMMPPPSEPGPPVPLAATGTAVTSSGATTAASTMVTSSDAHESPERDARHVDDPQHVMEYMPDIYHVLHKEEVLHVATPGYMDRQVQVNAKMRGILVDWLVSVQLKYKLRAETLFLAINLIDRYLDVRCAARRHLQLIGVTAMLIAAKFEEMYPPQISDFVYVTDKAYTKDDIIKMEVTILNALDFKICRPTPVTFLDRYQCVNGCTEAHRDLAQYLLELTLVEYSMIKYSPSRLAAASILLSNKLLRRQPSWKPAAVKQTGFMEQTLKECAKEMCEILDHANVNPLQAVRKKFSQLKYHSVAKLNFSHMVAAPCQSIPFEEARPAAPRRSLGGSAAQRWSVGGASDAPPLAPRHSCGKQRESDARISNNPEDNSTAHKDTITSLN